MSSSESTSPEAPEPSLEERYNSVKNMIYKLCVSFSRKYGGDVEELFSESSLHFMKACASYDPKKAKFTTWVYKKVLWGLTKTKQDQAQLVARMPTVNPDNLEELEDKQHFDLESLMKEVSPRASSIVELSIDDSPPQEESELRPEVKRNLIIEYLLDIGWAGQEILSSLKEIKDALK